MHYNHLVHHPFNELQYRIPKSNNHLGIQRIDLITDRKRNQFILLMKSPYMLTGDIQALMKGPNLILEAAFEPDYGKPFRIHVTGREYKPFYEYDDSLIGFSEIRLNPGYHYRIVSSEILNSGLIKVILKYRPYEKNSIYKN